MAVKANSGLDIYRIENHISDEFLVLGVLAAFFIPWLGDVLLMYAIIGISYLTDIYPRDDIYEIISKYSLLISFISIVLILYARLLGKKVVIIDKTSNRYVSYYDIGFRFRTRCFSLENGEKTDPIDNVSSSYLDLVCRKNV